MGEYHVCIFFKKIALTFMIKVKGITLLVRAAIETKRNAAPIDSNDFVKHPFLAESGRSCALHPIQTDIAAVHPLFEYKYPDM